MIEASNLAQVPTVRHGFFTREGGCSRGLYAGLNCSFSSGDEAENVTRNREHVATVLGVTGDRLAVARQIHSADVVTVDVPWSHEAAPKADGLVTAVPNIALGVTTADCAPVLFADEAAGIIGAAHAGWRGALSGVTDATIEAMEKLGARRGEIVAAVGPTISQANYEVGPELRDAFLREDEDSTRHFEPSGREGHFLFDLPAYLERRLGRARLGSIEVMNRCTYADEDRFFSFRRTTHRAEQVYGCQLSAITLGPDRFLKEI